MWLRKKTQNIPTSCTNYRLNPHDQPGRFRVYKIYKRLLAVHVILQARIPEWVAISFSKRSLRAPTKENTPVLIAVEGTRTHRSRSRLESELPIQQVQRSAQCWYSYAFTSSVDSVLFVCLFVFPSTLVPPIPLHCSC